MIHTGKSFEFVQFQNHHRIVVYRSSFQQIYTQETKYRLDNHNHMISFPIEFQVHDTKVSSHADCIHEVEQKMLDPNQNQQSANEVLINMK